MDAKDEGPKETISARVRVSTMERLRKLAEATERKISWLVDKAIAEYVEQHGQEKKRGK